MFVGAKLESSQAQPTAKSRCLALRANYWKREKKHCPGNKKQETNLKKKKSPSMSEGEKARTDGRFGEMVKRTFKRSNLPQNLGQ